MVNRPGELLLNPPNRERPTSLVFQHMKQKTNKLIKIFIKWIKYHLINIKILEFVFDM